MKELVYIQKWENQILYNIICVNDNDVVYSYSLSNCYDFPKIEYDLSSVYVYGEYRNKGYFNKMMNDILSDKHNIGYKRLFISVLKTNFILNKYRKFGFRSYMNTNSDEKYIWLRKII